MDWGELSSEYVEEVGLGRESVVDILGVGSGLGTISCWAGGSWVVGMS